jgi:hypothetical protein
MYSEQSTSLATPGTQPIVFKQCDELRMLLNEIAAKLHPVLHEGMGAEKVSSGEKPSAPVALHRELNGLIELARTIKGSIVL